MIQTWDIRTNWQLYSKEFTLRVVAAYQLVLVSCVAGEERCITAVLKLWSFCILSAFCFINSANEKHTLGCFFPDKRLNGGRQQAWRQLKNVLLLYKTGLLPWVQISRWTTYLSISVSLGLFPKSYSYYTAQYFTRRGQHFSWTNYTQQTVALLLLCPVPNS